LGHHRSAWFLRHRVSRFVGQIGDQAAGRQRCLFLFTKMTLRSWFQLDASSLLARRSKRNLVELVNRGFASSATFALWNERRVAGEVRAKTIQVWSFLFQTPEWRLACRTRRVMNSSSLLGFTRMKAEVSRKATGLLPTPWISLSTHHIRENIIGLVLSINCHTTNILIQWKIGLTAAVRLEIHECWFLTCIHQFGRVTMQSVPPHR
jgi:hypothetical protein